MQVAKFLDPDGLASVGIVEQDAILLLKSDENSPSNLLTRILSDDSPGSAARACVSPTSYPLDRVTFLAPLDSQEVWGAGVTYERSKVAREEESEQGGSFYDLVYRADRPELFFKATRSRVADPGKSIRVRADSSWSVPEPELALVLDSNLRLVGYTIGNDVSARDIEGRNPLYLPQAKVYDGCCGLGPWITLADSMPPTREIGIRLSIRRGGKVAFEGASSIARMARSFPELIDWLGRENVFPDGVILLTGTGIVPPDEFSLASGDEVEISIDGIGTLSNPVA